MKQEYLYINTRHNKNTECISISFIFAYTLKPLRNILCEKIKIKKKTASIVITLSIIFSISVFIYILIPSILKESYNLGNILDNIDVYIETLAKKEYPNANVIVKKDLQERNRYLFIIND